MRILDFLKIYIHGALILFLSWSFIYLSSTYLVYLIGYRYPIGIIFIVVIVLLFPLAIGFTNFYVHKCFFDREDEVTFPLWTNGLIMLLMCSLMLITYDILNTIVILPFIPLLLGVYGRLTERD